uniref:Uncharacterized protein n=1 Tax=Loa loa TaxID=7209 RepID=A0A1I7VKH5_LOALO
MLSCTSFILSCYLSIEEVKVKKIEYKENVSINVDEYGVVTSYEKEGKRYLPSLLKKRMLCEDDNINDELGYDAFELNGSVPKIAKLSRSVDRSPISVACSRRYNLRKRLNGNNNSLKIHNLDEAETVDLVKDNNDLDDNRNDGGNQNEIFHVRRVLDDEKEKRIEQRKICENAEGSICEKQLSSNEINDQEMCKSRKALRVADEFHSDSKESEVTMSCSKNEIGNFRCEVSGNQVEYIVTESESGMSQCTEFANNTKSLAIDNDQFGVKIISNEISKTVTGNSASISTVALAQEKQEVLAFENIIDEELKQLLTYILNKRQLKGVEKMKTEKILELRAEEAKRLGIGLRSYLRKMQMF